MKIEYDPNKRRDTLAARGIDFESIGEVFDEFHLIRADER